MNPTDEKELVDGCLRQERSAQQRLYDRYAGLLLAVSMRYANSKEEGEDILIDGFAKIFSHLSDFRFDCSLFAWMKQVMVHTAISHFRQNHRHHNQLELEEVPESVCGTEAQGASGTVLAKDLLAMIQQMPEPYRMVFNLGAIEGYSHKEIADMLGMKESTSRSTLTRARNWLKQKLGEF